MGRSGEGTLSGEAGGVVSTPQGYIGLLSPDSVGTVTVTGEGSELNISGDLIMSSGYASASRTQPSYLTPILSLRLVQRRGGGQDVELCRGAEPWRSHNSEQRHVWLPRVLLVGIRR